MAGASNARINLVMEAKVQVLLARIIVIAGEAISRIPEHAAKLHNLERTAVLSQSCLYEERRSLGFKSNRCRGNQDDGRCDDQQCAAYHQIECALGRMINVSRSRSVSGRPKLIPGCGR